MKSAKNPCHPIRKLGINQPCSGHYSEVYVVEKSKCQHGRVKCPFGLVRRGSQCVRPRGRLPQGSRCRHTDDCLGDMWCGLKKTCQCLFDHLEFNSRLNKCVKKAIGSSCVVDSDCHATGGVQDSFTWRSAQCIDGKCQCGRHTETNVTYIDGSSGNLVTKMICIGSNATVVPTSQTCFVDPVYYGDNPLAQICGKESICFSCPGEDPDPSIGKCRKVIGKPQVTKCNKGTSDMIKQDSCENDSDCQPNQNCVQSFCGKTCKCSKGFVEKGTSSSCFPEINLKINDTCKENSKEENLPLNAICEQSQVICKDSYKAVENHCLMVEDDGKGFYGDRCKSASGCQADLWCDIRTGTCRCPQSKAYKWSQGRCVKREFGDQCQNDNDCSVYGSVESGGYNYGGGRCFSGVCVCSRYFKPAIFQYAISANETAKKVICVHRSSKVNIEVGDYCTVDPIFYGDNPLGMTRICERNSICLRCPSVIDVDSISKQRGICTRVPSRE